MASEKKLSDKAARMLGRDVPEAKPKAKPLQTWVSEPDFIDKETTSIKTKIIFPRLAELFATSLLKGRQTVEGREYSLNQSTYLMNIERDPLIIQTHDGAQISALSLGNPHAKHCVIVFQGKDGNFKSAGNLQTLANYAQETDTRIIAFNYRDNPKSTDSFIYDGAAVTRYALSQGIPAGNISLYGESMGGAVAAETASKLQEEKVMVKAVVFRAPKSLAYAAKGMELKKAADADPSVQAMPEEKKSKIYKLISIVEKIQTNVPRTFARNVINHLFGRDFQTEKTLNSLDANRVMIGRVEDDPMITQNATAGHDYVQTRVFVTTDPDKHNANLQKLTLKAPQPSSNKSTDYSNRNSTIAEKTPTALNLFRDFVNPDYGKTAVKSR